MGSNSRLTVLTRRSDFLRLMKSGQRIRPSEWVLINFSSNDLGVMRCGWTLPRHVGGAVVRNKLKRWARIYFRALIEAQKSLPVDVNLVFRKAENDFYKKLDYEKFVQVMDCGWRQVGRRLEERDSPLPRSLPVPRDGSLRR